ncbi:6258_t:CDS:2, partial [Funneliformis caledonium]
MSILGILEFARPKLSLDTINDFKKDLYTVLQRYLEKLRQFIIELEYNTETRMNVTSAYTIEVLKDQQDNRKLINQLRKDNISSINSNLEDGQEQVNEKILSTKTKMYKSEVNVQVTCDRIASLRSADPSTGASQSNFQENGEKDEEEDEEEDEGEDGEKDEEEDEDEDEVKDEDNVTNNNANYVAMENYPENNYNHNNDFVEVTYVNRLEFQSRTRRWLLSSGTDVLN